MFKSIRNILVTLALSALGVYVLRSYQTTIGLGVGTGAILLALTVAFPTQLHAGLLEFRSNITLVVPVIVDAIRGAKPASGGTREGDPPAESES